MGQKFLISCMADENVADYVPKRGESWYNVRLPGSLIKWDSPRGKYLFEHSHLISPAIKHFTKQIKRTFCGPCSLAIAVNAFGLATKLLGCHRGGDKAKCVNEDDIANFHLARPVFEKAGLERNGVSLSELASVTRNLNFKVEMFHVQNPAVTEFEARMGDKTRIHQGLKICSAPDEFKEICKIALQDSNLVILNYNMESLGFKDLGGHFSPIGAYSKQEDMFLILDVWPETPPAWVKTNDIFKAMATADKSSNITRGFMVLTSMHCDVQL